MKKKIVIGLLIAVTLLGAFAVTVWNGEKPNKEEEFSPSEFITSLSLKYPYTVQTAGSRVGSAYASITVDTICDIDATVDYNTAPIGYDATVRFKSIEDKNFWYKCQLLPNRLIGVYQLENNLFAGTKQLKDELRKEEMKIYNYIDEHEKARIVYRITPVYEKDDDIIVKELILEACTYDDVGKDFAFKKVIENKQDGFEIDYKTGEVTENEKK